MLVGTADVDALAAGAATIDSFDTEAVVFDDVLVLHALFELPYAVREALLPPALHPTNPPIAAVLAWRVERSEWGPFSMVQVNIGCRSGARPRRLVSACVVDGPTAVGELSRRWGLPAAAGDVRLRRGYDAAELALSTDDGQQLDLRAVDPEPLDSADVQPAGLMTLARTPRGLRLVQVEPTYAFGRVERLRPRAERVAVSLLGGHELDLRHPISAFVGMAVTIPPIRFVCRPDVLAFEGTETVDRPA